MGFLRASLVSILCAGSVVGAFPARAATAPAPASQSDVPFTDQQFLSGSKSLPMPCAESLTAFGTAPDPAFGNFASQAKSCSALFGVCRATPGIDQKVGYRADFNDRLIKQVVGVHLDLLYKKGIYAAGVDADGKPLHPGQKWSPPDRVQASPACNLSCGEVTKAKGVRQDVPYSGSCGIWGWENGEWGYKSEENYGSDLDSCVGVHNGDLGYSEYFTFSDSKAVTNQALDKMMKREVTTKNGVAYHGSDMDCEGIVTADFKNSTRFSAYETGALVQATWVALDEVLTEANQAGKLTIKSPACAALAADTMNDLRVGVRSLFETDLCGPTKPGKVGADGVEGPAVPNDLAHLTCDPDHPEKDAGNPPIQADCSIRALITATQSGTILRVAECEVYARAHQRFSDLFLSAEGMVADVDRIHNAFVRPAKLAGDAYDDTMEPEISAALWGGSGGKVAVKERFYNQWLNAFWKWIYEPKAGSLQANGAAADSALTPLQIEGYPSPRLVGTRGIKDQRGETTDGNQGNIQITKLAAAPSAANAPSLEDSASKDSPSGCQLLDRTPTSVSDAPLKGLIGHRPGDNTLVKPPGSNQGPSGIVPFDGLGTGNLYKPNPPQNGGGAFDSANRYRANPTVGGAGVGNVPNARLEVIPGTNPNPVFTRRPENADPRFKIPPVPQKNPGFKVPGYGLGLAVIGARRRRKKGASRMLPLLGLLAWLGIAASLPRPALAGNYDDDYYFFIKGRCHGMNGILLTNKFAQECCDYSESDRLHPTTKMDLSKLSEPGGSAQAVGACPGPLDDLVAEVHERALPPDGGGGTGSGGGGGWGGGGGGAGGTVQAAANAIRALAGNAAPANGGPTSGAYASGQQSLGATDSMGFSNRSGSAPTGAGAKQGAGGNATGRGGAGQGAGSGLGGGGTGGGEFGRLSTAPATGDDAAKKAAATAGAGGQGEGSLYAGGGRGGEGGGGGSAENTVDKVEWNIPGQNGEAAGAKGETAETEDPSDYFDRIRSDESLFKRVEARYEKKRPQFPAP